VAIENFDNIVKNSNILLDMETPQELETSAHYVQGWRIRLWDHAFLSYFKGHEYFKKSSAFKDLKGSDLVVKRIIFKLELLLLFFLKFTYLSISLVHHFASFANSNTTWQVYQV
jgi:hypothetical protein